MNRYWKQVSSFPMIKAVVCLSILFCLFSGAVADLPAPRSILPYEPASDRAGLSEMLSRLELEVAPNGNGQTRLELEPGTLRHFKFDLQPVERDMAEQGGKTKPDYGILTVGVSDGYLFQGSSDLKLLFTSVTGDIYAPNAYSGMNYYRATRNSDWIVVTVDGSVWPKRDSIQWRLALMAGAMRFMSESLPGFSDANIAFGGYSGGSKLSIYLAMFSLRLGKVPAGLFLGGCNEVPFADAEKLCGVSTAGLYDVPIIFSIGEKDRIAKPFQTRREIRALEREGFTNINGLTHPGGHHLVGAHIMESLEQFDE